MSLHILCCVARFDASAMASIDQDIERTLARSRRLNRMNGVTGAMILTDTAVVQWLEGDEASVVDTFACASADPRLAQLRQVLRGPAAERLFAPSWMYFVDARSDSRAGLAPEIAALAADAEGATPAMVRAAMQAAAKRLHACAATRAAMLV